MVGRFPPTRLALEGGTLVQKATNRPTLKEPNVHRFPVSELYGPVCQGEGQLIGKPTVFVRFGGCDYRCSWCDSLYAVLPQHRHEWTKMTRSEIVKRVLDLIPGSRVKVGRLGWVGHVTFSGGNPAIHDLSDLIDDLHDQRIRVGIETQGSIIKPWMVKVDDLTLSPKPPSSGNITPFDPSSPLASIIHRGCHGQDVLKVVVFDDQDYAYAKAVHLAYPLVPFYLQAGTKVNEATRDDLCASLLDWQEAVLNDPDMQDVAVLPQLHAILKGHARGI